MFMMLSFFSICEVVRFPMTQYRKFNEVCYNDMQFEKSIFEFEDPFKISDDSDDGINISGIISPVRNKNSCKYDVYVSQQLKDRTLAFFNRVRWLTGYRRNLTWDDSKDIATCQCSFVSWATGRLKEYDESEKNFKCTKKAPKWKEGCKNSIQIFFGHKKMSIGILYLGNDVLDQRNFMLSPSLTGTSMCTVSSGKGSVDFFTMNFQTNESLKEEIPFIASPPPGFIPYYMMPSVVGLLAKDIKTPKKSEFKIYYNGKLINTMNKTQQNSHGEYEGYTFNLGSVIKRNYSHLLANFSKGAFELFFPPGSVFGFEATNNGKTYAWNTTLVDCTRDAGKYPDPKPPSPASTPKGKPIRNVATRTRSMSNNGGASSQKSGLSKKQKVGIGVGVTVGLIILISAAVVIGLFISGIIGMGSAAAAGGPAASAYSVAKASPAGATAADDASATAADDASAADSLVLDA